MSERKKVCHLCLLCRKNVPTFVKSATTSLAVFVHISERSNLKYSININYGKWFR